MYIYDNLNTTINDVAKTKLLNNEIYMKTAIS